MIMIKKIHNKKYTVQNQKGNIQVGECGLINLYHTIGQIHHQGVIYKFQTVDIQV